MITADNAKEMRCVITFLVVCALLVLGSAIVEESIIDYLYFVFVICCLIKYLFICNKK